MRDAVMLAIGLVVGLLIGWCFWLDQVLQRQAAERRAKAADDRLAASGARSATELAYYREGPPCEHAREILGTRMGALAYSCLDCGRTRELGPVFPSDYCHRKAS